MSSVKEIIIKEIEKELRTIPVFYRDRDIIKSKQTMIHYLQFLIDMQFFELSGAEKVKDKLLFEYDDLSIIIERLNVADDYENLVINGVNIYKALSRCYFCASPIDPKDYKTIIERLEKHKDKNYHQYYLLAEAYVNDYIFIYHYTCYDYEISEMLDDKKIKDKWRGTSPVAIYQVPN